MNIVVTVKQVPDTWAEKKLDPSDMTTDRATVDNVLNEMDEYGVEEALLLKEAHGGEVTAVTMGPDKAVEAVRKALQMGADKGVHLCDASLHGSDALQTASALAKVIAPLNPDVVIVSSEASDARGGVVGALLAEYLGLPQLTLARKVTADPGAGTVVDRAADRERVRHRPGQAARRRGRRRKDQRTPVPVLQGHHGGQEEAAVDHDGRRRGYRRRLGGPVGRLQRGGRGPAAAAQGSRASRQGRG